MGPSFCSGSGSLVPVIHPYAFADSSCRAVFFFAVCARWPPYSVGGLKLSCCFFIRHMREWPPYFVGGLKLSGCFVVCHMKPPGNGSLRRLKQITYTYFCVVEVQSHPCECESTSVVKKGGYIPLPGGRTRYYDKFSSMRKILFLLLAPANAVATDAQRP